MIALRNVLLSVDLCGSDDELGSISTRPSSHSKKILKRHVRSLQLLAHAQVTWLLKYIALDSLLHNIHN
jgi:hypothetical protein